MANHFGEKVHEIKGFHIQYKNAKVSKIRTAISTLQTGIPNLLANFKTYLHVKKDFFPDIIISDFESFTYFFAQQHRLPYISIDNPQVIDRCTLEIPIPSSMKADYTIAKSIVKAKVPKANHYLISSFFDAPIRKLNTEFIPPIIRKEILALKPTTSSHILVYQSSNTAKNLITTLQNVERENFFVYGFNKDESHGNVTLKKFSETEFIKDLASAKAVIANGGYSFISEALYLKKPICSFPIKGQFEQYVNAAYIEKLGYGKYISEITSDNIKSFLYDYEKYISNLKKFSQDGNKITFQKVDKLLLQFQK